MNKSYPCPKCGSTESWIAHYMVGEYQTIELASDGSGGYEFVDYTGTTGSTEAVMEDESYECRNCGYTIELGTVAFVPKGESA
jgi:predicted nucleic-acid-binding Zn-ribbon protein